MIAKLKGIVDSTGEDWVILDVGGVGYLVFCSTRTLGRLPSSGEAMALLIETHVREDQIALYGFADQSERDWFRLLTTVQGVGTKVALALLSALTADQLVQAIGAQDKTMLTRAKGVGPKLAARILNELKDKAGRIAMKEMLVVGTKAAPAVSAAADGQDAVVSDAISALVNLGYGRAEAYGAVAQALQAFDATPPVSALIRAGLKELSTALREHDR